MQGTPLASHWSATGLVVSGVEVARTTSTPSVLIRSVVTSAARLESDWLSLSTIDTPYVRSPTLIGFFAKWSVIWRMTYESASPKGARAPDCGETYPTLMAPAAPPLPPA